MTANHVHLGRKFTLHMDCMKLSNREKKVIRARIQAELNRRYPHITNFADAEMKELFRYITRHCTNDLRVNIEAAVNASKKGTIMVYYLLLNKYKAEIENWMPTELELLIASSDAIPLHANSVTLLGEMVGLPSSEFTKVKGALERGERVTLSVAKQTQDIFDMFFE